MMNNKKESFDVALLREKIRLKKIDRKVYVEEMENLLNGNREKRNALRIGNDCLRFMTRRQNNMSVAINTKIFESRSRRERLPMMKCNLTSSIVKNDSKLFKYGKRLMKQDHDRIRSEAKMRFYTEEAERAVQDTAAYEAAFRKSSESFLSAEVKVEDYKNRLVSAKLVYQNLQKILAALETDLKLFPDRIKDIELIIHKRKQEVDDFLELKAGALRFLHIEESQLIPLNEELKAVNIHFERIIANKKQELDDRRKNNSLAKFLSDRETHGFNFTGSSNITEMKIEARNKALSNAQEMLRRLMDAMLVSDVKFVVDCIMDQDDVTKLLLNEKEKWLKEKAVLEADLERLKRNYNMLRFNDVRQARVRNALEEGLRVERLEKKRYEDFDFCLRQRDKLISDLNVALHAMFERLRPIRTDDATNFYKGSLSEDIKNFINKLMKMKNMIEKNTVPVGRVKPMMLHLFKEKRVPSDSVRVETEKGGIAGQMQALEAFESDQPGFTSREMLKQRAHEIAAKHKKVKAP